MTGHWEATSKDIAGRVFSSTLSTWMLVSPLSQH